MLVFVLALFTPAFMNADMIIEIPGHGVLEETGPNTFILHCNPANTRCAALHLRDDGSWGVLFGPGTGPVIPIDSDWELDGTDLHFTTN